MNVVHDEVPKLTDDQVERLEIIISNVLVVFKDKYILTKRFSERLNDFGGYNNQRLDDFMNDRIFSDIIHDASENYKRYMSIFTDDVVDLLTLCKSRDVEAYGWHFDILVSPLPRYEYVESIINNPCVKEIFDTIKVMAIERNYVEFIPIDIAGFVLTSEKTPSDMYSENIDNACVYCEALNEFGFFDLSFADIASLEVDDVCFANFCIFDQILLFSNGSNLIITNHNSDD